MGTLHPHLPQHIDREPNLVEQLHATLAKISLWNLIQTSPSYHRLIQEASKKVVSPPCTRLNDIMFLQDELPSLEVKNKSDSLMITPCIYEHKIKDTFIDNGSNLNVCSINLLDKINWDYSFLQPNSLNVCGFDNVNRKSLGTITLPITIGPMTLPAPIHVMPNTLNYNLLLGRLRIHAIKEVPSTLHHTIKDDPNPYNVVQDEVESISFFNTMFPSII